MQQQPGDVELGRIRDGYPALATYISRDPDHDTYIFRTFGRLSTRNILHLQCQLTELEHELQQLDEAARQSADDDAKQALRRFETLSKLAKDKKRANERKRLQVMSSIGKKMEQYHTALTLQDQIINIQRPSNRALVACREYVNGTAIPKYPSPVISGRASHYLSDANDLAALGQHTEGDGITRFLQSHWPRQKRISSDPYDRTTVFPRRHVEWTVSAISITLAAVLLIGAIVSLYFVTGQKARLGMIGMYTVLFAGSIALLSTARKAEVFAATAAYAAVLVVFVSGDLGNSQETQCLMQLDTGVFKPIACPG